MDMTTIALKDIDFERHRRQFGGVAGDSLAFGICDGRGLPLWTAVGSDGLVAQALAALGPDARAWDSNGAGFGHLPIGGGCAALYAPIVSPSEEPLGWLVAAGDGAKLDPAAPRFASIAQALVDGAAAIREEERLRQELDCLAAELAERYEELHLVYGIDSHIREFHGGWDVLRKPASSK